MSVLFIGNIVFFIYSILYTITTFQVKELIPKLVGIVNLTALDTIVFFNTYLLVLGVANSLFCLITISYIVTTFISGNIFKSIKNQII